jgi:hypothetical protein
MSQQYNASLPGLKNQSREKSSETLKGKDSVRLGEIETIRGNLVQKGDEWELRAGDVRYEIHMGPNHYRNAQGLVLKDGTDAVVTGFVNGTDLSVTAIEIGGQSVMLRDETGRPGWAGTSYGKGPRSVY